MALRRAMRNLNLSRVRQVLRCKLRQLLLLSWTKFHLAAISNLTKSQRQERVKKRRDLYPMLHLPRLKTRQDLGKQEVKNVSLN